MTTKNLSNQPEEIALKPTAELDLQDLDQSDLQDTTTPDLSPLEVSPLDLGHPDTTDQDPERLDTTPEPDLLTLEDRTPDPELKLLMLLPLLPMPLNSSMHQAEPTEPDLEDPPDQAEATPDRDQQLLLTLIEIAPALDQEADILDKPELTKLDPDLQDLLSLTTITLDLM